MARFVPGTYIVECQGCRIEYEHGDTLRPVCRKRGPGKPRDRVMGLAPMRRVLMMPRRESRVEPLNVVLPARDAAFDDGGDVAQE